MPPPTLPTYPTMIRIGKHRFPDVERQPPCGDASCRHTVPDGGRQDHWRRVRPCCLCNDVLHTIWDGLDGRKRAAVDPRGSGSLWVGSGVLGTGNSKDPKSFWARSPATRGAGVAARTGRGDPPHPPSPSRHRITHGVHMPVPRRRVPAILAPTRGGGWQQRTPTPSSPHCGSWCHRRPSPPACLHAVCTGGDVWPAESPGA